MTKMNRVGAAIFSSLSFVILALSFSAALVAADDEYRPPEINLPEGFTAELVAAPPLVAHPLMANFDERGRLFIAEIAGRNLSREELEKELPNFIRMLEDKDGDGKFDKSTIFADKMTMPQGALWYRGALYSCSSGGLWRLEDTDDDGVADKREKIVGDFGYTGNAADVHGPFLSPAGASCGAKGDTATSSKTKRAASSARERPLAFSRACPTAATSKSSAAAAWITRSRSTSRPKARCWGR